MKKAPLYILTAVFAAATAALAVRNQTLGTELAEARSALAAKESEPKKAPRQPPAPKAAPRKPVVREEAAPPAIDPDAFDRAVEERAEALVEERRQRREEERAERRRAWENETEEERATRRREFQERMREHASERLTAFAEKAGLDDRQCTAVETELGLLDSRIREIVGTVATAVGQGEKFDFEAQMHWINSMSAAVLDAYTGLDKALPEGWRESDDEFNVMLGIGPDAFNPLLEAMRKSGVRGGFGGIMPFMGGPRRRPPAPGAGAPDAPPQQ